MNKRKELHELLENVIGNSNVYYQPPASITMQYPAIVYSRSNIDNTHAENKIYKQTYAYDVIVIDYVADSEIVAKVAKLPYCSFNRHYTSDNLYHDSFTIYY